MAGPGVVVKYVRLSVCFCSARIQVLMKQNVFSLPSRKDYILWGIFRDRKIVGPYSAF